MNESKNKDMETRLKALEDQVHHLNEDFSRVIFLISSNLPYAERLRPAPREQQRGALLVHDSQISALSRYDSFLMNNYLFCMSLICFILGGALVLRFVTEERYISPTLGVFIGVTYCYFIIAAGYIINRRSFNAARISGVLGIILTGLILIESAYHFQALSIQSYFWIILISMILSFAFMYRIGYLKIACLCLTLQSLLFFSLTYPDFQYNSTCLLLLLSLIPITLSSTGNRVSADQVVHLTTVFLILFLWNRELNGTFNKIITRAETGLNFFPFYLFAFSLILLFPTTYYSYKGIARSSLEKILPFCVILFCFYFSLHHSDRTGMDRSSFLLYCLAISSLTIAIDLFFGLKSKKSLYSPGALTLPCVILYLISSAMLFQSIDSVVVSWLILAMIYLVSSCLNSSFSWYYLSLTLHFFSFFVYSTVSFIEPSSAYHPYLFIMLIISLSLLYFTRPRSTMQSEDRMHPNYAEKTLSLLNIFCIIFSAYFLFDLWIHGNFTQTTHIRFIESLWLSLFASLLLLTGDRFQNPDFVTSGLALLVAAAVKTLVIDPFLGIQEFYTLSVISFGILMAINAYLYQKTKRKAL